MKYLSHYLEEKQSKAFRDTGAFFAFSNKQFAEKKQAGIKYVSMGAGMICPKENSSKLIALLDDIHQKGIEADIAENGIKAIIHRELANHEAQITYDIEDTLNSLDGYPITREMVQVEWEEYLQVCIDNDYF